MAIYIRRNKCLAGSFTLVSTFVLLMLVFYLIAGSPFGYLQHYEHIQVEIMATDKAECIEINQLQGRITMVS